MITTFGIHSNIYIKLHIYCFISNTKSNRDLIFPDNFLNDKITKFLNSIQHFRLVTLLPSLISPRGHCICKILDKNSRQKQYLAQRIKTFHGFQRQTPL